MKPTPQISSRHNTRRIFPPTDYAYRTQLENPGVAKQTPAAHELHGFWKLSTGFLGAEAKLIYATELLLFSVITTISAWPIVSAIVAVTRMVRNY